jgi:hypothetical protein
MILDIPQSDVIAIASLLFALVGLLGTFFFVSLSQWLSGILANSVAWGVIGARDPNKTEYAARLDCYYKARESRSWPTFLAWLVITVFLTLIIYRLVLLGGQIKADIQPVVSRFVIQPCLIFFLIYIVISVLFLAVGFGKSSDIINQFESDQNS